MLKWFRCKNSYSYSNETFLTMYAKGCRDNSDFVVKMNNEELLSIASIFGANGYGKSNLLNSVSDMLTNILMSNHDLKIVPFYFNPTQKNEPTEHELSVVIGNHEYRYGYVADKFYVYSEWFLVKEQGHDESSYLFKRDRSDVYFGEVLDENIRNFLKMFCNDRQSFNKSLLITILINLNSINEISMFFQWIKNACLCTNTDEHDFFNNVIPAFYKDDDYLRAYIDFLKAFDDRIIGAEIKPEFRITEASEHYRMYIHYHFADMLVPFEYESAGLKRLSLLFSTIYEALIHGSLALIDELDVHQHPWVVRKFVALFHDRNANPKCAQLIFTSHSTLFMNSKDMRKDEVFFVEKDSNGCSLIHSLGDFNLDIYLNERNIDFGNLYLRGRFGAMPLFSQQNDVLDENE